MALNIFNKKNKFPAEEKEEVLGDDFPELPELPELPDFTGQDDIPDAPPEMPRRPQYTPPPPRSFESPESNIERFRAGFRSPDELRPPLAREPQGPGIPLPQPPMPPESLPPYEGVEPLAMPKPRDMMVSQFGQSRSPESHRMIKSPHMFIRVDKYKDIMASLAKLHENINETKKDMEEMDRIDRHETSKLKESAEVVLEIESMLRYLEETFTEPQD
ncbi:MAG TPA: hypothetical protein ENN30_00785 [Candidatus Woesearchaeota archaeon]|nr:hypothetical protein [Candidatus Woesearchaeota archaeon]